MLKTPYSKFIEEIEELLFELVDAMPLQSYCSHGGCVGDTDEASITGLRFDRITGILWSGRCTVHFIEVNRTSCKDYTFEDRIQATIGFVYNIETGQFEFEEVETPSGE